MRRNILATLALVVAAGSAPAQTREKVSFQSVRIGYTGISRETDADNNVIVGQRPDFLYKPGSWVPVVVNVLNNGKYELKADGQIYVTVQVVDSDETATKYTVPLPPFDDKTLKSSAIVYARPGSNYAEFTVSLTNDRGRNFCKEDQRRSASVTPQGVIYLAIGSRAPKMAMPGRQNAQFTRNEIGLIDRVAAMPPDWFGYGAADVIVLGTADRMFLNELAGDKERCKAIAEWVRRGGRLVVSLGNNRDVFIGTELGELAKVLPMALDGKPYTVANQQFNWKDGGRAGNEGMRPVKGAQQLEFTKFVPRPADENRSYYSLMDGPTEAGGSPLIAQGAFGLGRVTAVAFDLDIAPFTDFKGNQQFWMKLLEQAGPRPSMNDVQQYNRFGPNADASDGELSGLVKELENFEGVPVISFGWVALFILIYIIIVGPLDYFFLKKVVKRLELTWVTFPTVVLGVSAAAYFAAYYLKGSELRINKVDVVDFDLSTKRAYGHSWFSVFSPRIQKYTVGIEPAAPNWALAPTSPGEGTVVSWMGVSKSTRQSLFSHSYDYAPKAEGLVGVPIQVWSTKGFEGNWEAKVNDTKPVDGSRVRHPPGKPNEIIGSIVNNLPVALEDAILIYRGEVAPLGRLEPGVPKSVTAQERVKFETWRTSANTTIDELKMRLLFHERVNASNADPTNGSLRSLDASWRIRDTNRDEVIVVGRLPTVIADGKSNGPNGTTVAQRPTAEEMMAGPSMPARLWLGKLPGEGGTRPPVPGSLRQTTIVRVFLPVPSEPDVK